MIIRESDLKWENWGLSKCDIETESNTSLGQFLCIHKSKLFSAYFPLNGAYSRVSKGRSSLVAMTGSSDQLKGFSAHIYYTDKD